MWYSAIQYSAHFSAYAVFERERKFEWRAIEIFLVKTASLISYFQRTPRKAQKKRIKNV